MGQRKFLKERWNNACGRAISALQDLQQIQDEFEEWDSSLGNLRKAGWNILFDEIRYIDFENILAIIKKAQELDLPSSR